MLPLIKSKKKRNGLRASFLLILKNTNTGDYYGTETLFDS